MKNIYPLRIPKGHSNINKIDMIAKCYIISSTPS